MSLFVGGGRACFVPLRARIELGGCGGIEAGAVQGKAFGPDADPSSGFAPWVAATAMARASLNVVGRLSIGLDVGIAVPLVPGNVAFTGPSAGVTLLPGAQSTSVTFQSSPVAGRLLLGPEIRF
jgi:hypothetical protein